MKHEGKAWQTAVKLACKPLVVLLAALAGLAFAVLAPGHIALAAIVLAGLWVVYAGFVFFFFRDPEAKVPPDANAIVAPAHGKVDVIEQTEELEFIGGRCHRISIFLSLFDVHVQNAPVTGKVVYFRHHPGEFLNALRLESAARNENVMIGLESSEAAGERIGVRLIAGVLARRIVPWITTSDAVNRGERISLIHFGSRCDLYLPTSACVKVKLGDKVAAGKTIVATRT